MMNRVIFPLLAIGILACAMGLQAQTAATVVAVTDAPRQTIPFDRAWKFFLGEAQGAQGSSYDDSNWRGLDIPHDWMIEGVPGADAAAMEGPFDKNSPVGKDGGYLNGGIGWYRKSFTVPESAKGKRISILFDGAYMAADVYLNGQKLGNHPYGYTSFSYDLTAVLKYGAEKNVLAVRLNVEQPCSRWYSGAGLYRHVWLVATDPVHVAQWGTFVTTPKVAANNSEVHVATEVQNDGSTASSATLTTILLDPSGKEVSRKEDTQQIAPGANATLNRDFSLVSAQLWSPESPVLYQAVSEVRVNGALTDSYNTTFGIRTVEFTKDNGFLLNGQRVQIKGVCDHHDLGCLGSIALKRGFERQLQILKGMGVNGLRTSHNPPSPEMLNLCDRMGFLVMDECFDEWKASKTKLGYGRFFDDWSQKDLVSMLHRDRNHPSIIVWSIGNEVTEGFTANGNQVAQPLTDTCHREDPTRLVTSALQQPSNAVKYNFQAALDVFGCNYQVGFYNDTRVKGVMPLLGSETSSQVDTRGEYGLHLDGQGKVQIDPKPRGQVSCYDLFHPGWATPAETDLISVRDATWNAGAYVWTGFDYIGEPTPYGWPSRSSYFGINDLCGFPKDRYYLYKSVWKADEPLVHILPSSWTWPGLEGKEIPVRIFTNADSVELFLNDKSLGVKNFPADIEVSTESKKNKGKPDTITQSSSLHLAWNVPYAPGMLKAVARKNGQVVANDEVHTAGEPAKISLTPDRTELDANGQDLAFIKIAILDKEGNVCPNADNEIAFSVDGKAAILAGLDNGDPTNHEPFQGTKHKAFHGLALAVLKTGYDSQGTVTLTATAEGLPSAMTTVQVKVAKP